MRKSKDKPVVVTGGGAGIGLATRERFGEAGFHVVMADIYPDAAQAVVDRITIAGGKAVPMIVDLTDIKGTRAAVEKVEADHGPIAVRGNNAGRDLFVPFAPMLDSVMDAVGNKDKLRDAFTRAGRHPVLRRRRLHHRPGDYGVRRPDHARLRRANHDRHDL